MATMEETRRISITDGEITVLAMLDESDTATGVWNALPFTGRVQRWGDEIYFPIPVTASLTPDATDVVTAGAVAFWPPGNALCLFWGPTPASVSDECRAASPVNVIGSVEGDASKLADMRTGAGLTVEKC